MILRRIVCFGASTTYGWKDSDGLGFVGLLKQWHEKRDSKNQLFNLGIVGQTTEQMLTRLAPEINARKPDFVLVQTGLNDTHREKTSQSPNAIPISQFSRNIEKMITQVSPIAKLAFLGTFLIDQSKTAPLAGTDWHYLLDDALEYASTTKQICDSSGVGFIDLVKGWNIETFKPYLSEDGLHCNNFGHNIIFQTVRDYVLKLETSESA